MKITDVVEGYTVLPPIDKVKYQPRDGLEGPFRLRNGKVVYYDPQEGSYYDPDTDMYISYDDYKQMDEANLNELGGDQHYGDATGAWDKGGKATPITAKKATKNALKTLNKAFKNTKKPEKGVAEGDPKSHQAQSTLKHLKKAGYSDRADAANIKPGVKGYRDRIAMLKRAKDEDNLKEDELDVKVAKFVDWVLSQGDKYKNFTTKPEVYAAAKKAYKAYVKTKTEGVAEGDKRPDYVVKASDKPKKIKPSMGGSSPHPYQGKLVGATEAEVSNTDYEWTHGKKPSGQGSWFFVAHKGGINFGKDVEGEDYIQLHQMSYGDAKKAAIKWAKSKGHTSLFVAT